MDTDTSSTVSAEAGTDAERATTADEERQRLAEVLGAEYSLLAALLSTAWSASLTRTSLFLFTLSASGVALGFAVQGDIERGPFRAVALVVLPLILFLGVATFVRLVQLQRESFVYLTGLNRIRRFMADSVPATRPYLVLPVHDDAAAIFRGPGTGMNARPPRYRLLNLVAQTQGIVGVVTSAVAAAIAGLAAAPLGLPAVAAIGTAAFALTLLVLMRYWQRSLADLWQTRPMFPTPETDGSSG